jgi:hypothetical protein
MIASIVFECGEVKSHEARWGGGNDDRNSVVYCHDEDFERM